MLTAGLGIAWAGAAVLALVDGRRSWAAGLALSVLAAALVATGILAVAVFTDGAVDEVAGDWPAGVGIRLRADALGIVFALLSLVVVIAGFAREVARGVEARAFPALILFLAAGLTGLFLTADVFNFYVFFELSMIAAYLLATYGQDEPRFVGAFIFAVVNLLGSFVFLLGVAGLYHLTGTLEMDAVAERIGGSDTSSRTLIAIAFLVAFGVKLGLFPFHFWLPAVYASARPGVAAILAGALANIGSYGLLRFGSGILDEQLEQGAVVVAVLGAASIVYGSVQAIARRSAVEVLAYSSIGQAGYVLVALAIGGPAGIAAAVVYAVVNSLNKALLFVAVGVRGWVIGGVFAVGAFSVCGVPPTAGFFGKLELFRAAVGADAVLLAILMFAGGALSFLYMFQLYQHDFWAEEREHGGALAPRAIAVAVAVLVVVVGVWPEPLLAAAREAAGALLSESAQ